MTTIAIAGATGAVGQQMLECLKERNIQADLKLLASARSKGCHGLKKQDVSLSIIQVLID